MTKKGNNIQGKNVGLSIRSPFNLSPYSNNRNRQWARTMMMDLQWSKGRLEQEPPQTDKPYTFN